MQAMVDLQQALVVHFGKTEATLFGFKRKLISVQDFSVICDGKKITTLPL